METPDLLRALTVVGSLPGHCPLEAGGLRERGGREGAGKRWRVGKWSRCEPSERARGKRQEEQK